MTEMDQINDAPPNTISKEDFERLPESVKEEIRQKWAEQAVRERAYLARLAKRRITGAVIGALGSGLVAIIVPAPWSFPPAIALTSAIMGVLIVHHRMSHISAIIAYGTQAIAMSLLFANVFAGSDRGGYGGGINGMFLFSSWIFHLFIGFVIAKLAEDRRSLEDAF